MLGALLLRIPFLFSSFWYDETFTAAVVSLRFDQLHKIIMSDVHPPLIYFLQWAWVQLVGSSEIALRLPSVAGGLFSIYLLYMLVRELGYNETTAEWAAILLALMPVHIWYSTEARGYTLLLCVVWILLIAILQNRSHWFLGAGLLGFIHAQGFIYLAVLGAGAVIYHRFNRRWILVVIFAGIISTLWLPFALVQSHDVSDGFWLMPLSLGSATTSFLVSSTIGQRFEPRVVPYVYTLLFGFSFYAFWVNRYSLYLMRKIQLMYWIILGAPLLTALISFSWHNVFMVRTLLPSGLLLCVVWSRTLLYAPYRNLSRVVLLPLVLASVVILYTPKVQRYDLRGVLGQCEDSDYIYLTSSNVAVSSHYYVDMPLYLWDKANDNNQWLSDEAKEALGFIPLSSPKGLHGTVCIPYQNNPITSDAQRKYIADLLQAPHTTEVITDLTYYKFVIYRIRYE